MSTTYLCGVYRSVRLLRGCGFVIMGLAAWCLVPQSHAQWVTQEVPLESGWNAVYLHVQPEPASCEAVVASSDVTIQEICTYNQTFSSVQFLTDIDARANPSNGLPAWLRWRCDSPPVDPERPLFALRGGKPYLVRVPLGTSGVWRVTGKPWTRPIEWRPERYNLVGFPVSRSAPTAPTFASFFAGCPEIRTNKVYRMDAVGSWDDVDASTDRMRYGESVWVRAGGVTDYQGPLSVRTPLAEGLDYAQTLVELPLVLFNTLDTNITATLEQLPSETPGSVPASSSCVGDVPLSWWNEEADGTAAGLWQSVTSSLVLDLPPGATTVDIAVRRMSMTNETARAARPLYASILRVAAAGCAVDVPVRAVGVRRAAPLHESAMSTAGLWAGDVVIDGVSFPHGSNATQRPLPVATGSEFPMRVLLHANTNGAVRLLQHVALLWQDGSYGPTNAAGYRSIEEDGRYVLITDDSDPRLAPAGSEDGLPRVRRLSTSSFPVRAPLQAIDSTTNKLRFVIHVAADEPCSPTFHRYHPDHDNREVLGHSGVVTNSVVFTDGPLSTWTNTHVNSWSPEAFDVTRVIEMAFLGVSGDTPPEWGSSTLGGIWREVVTGLHHKPIAIEGAFAIRRLIGVDALD
jgi:hypothetical protein